MSDEQRKEEEVEGHRWRVGGTEEPAQEGETEVEGHRWRVGGTEEPAEDDDEVEAHIRSYPNARMD
jgi:membrane protein implicated in regulation of membrane protease activity